MLTLRCELECRLFKQIMQVSDLLLPGCKPTIHVQGLIILPCMGPDTDMNLNINLNVGHSSIKCTYFCLNTDLPSMTHTCGRVDDSTKYSRLDMNSDISLYASHSS